MRVGSFASLHKFISKNILRIFLWNSSIILSRLYDSFEFTFILLQMLTSSILLFTYLTQNCIAFSSYSARIVLTIWYSSHPLSSERFAGLVLHVFGFSSQFSETLKLRAKRVPNNKWMETQNSRFSNRRTEKRTLFRVDKLQMQQRQKEENSLLRWAIGNVECCPVSRKYNQDEERESNAAGPKTK